MGNVSSSLCQCSGCTNRQRGIYKNTRVHNGRNNFRSGGQKNGHERFDLVAYYNSYVLARSQEPIKTSSERNGSLQRVAQPHPSFRHSKSFIDVKPVTSQCQTERSFAAGNISNGLTKKNLSVNNRENGKALDFSPNKKSSKECNNKLLRNKQLESLSSTSKEEFLSEAFEGKRTVT